MKEKLTDEFLATLEDLAVEVGWSLDLNEVIEFIKEAYCIAEKDMPQKSIDKLYNIRS